MGGHARSLRWRWSSILLGACSIVALTTILLSFVTSIGLPVESGKAWAINHRYLSNGVACWRASQAYPLGGPVRYAAAMPWSFQWTVEPHDIVIRLPVWPLCFIPIAGTIFSRRRHRATATPAIRHALVQMKRRSRWKRTALHILHISTLVLCTACVLSVASDGITRGRFVRGATTQLAIRMVCVYDGSIGWLFDPNGVPALSNFMQRMGPITFWWSTGKVESGCVPLCPVAFVFGGFAFRSVLRREAVIRRAIRGRCLNCGYPRSDELRAPCAECGCTLESGSQEGGGA